jgi:hypothetical protein
MAPTKRLRKQGDSAPANRRAEEIGNDAGADLISLEPLGALGGVRL